MYILIDASNFNVDELMVFKLLIIYLLLLLKQFF